MLQAAGALFTEQGFAKTSVEDIVARAGYTRGAFYSNFADKDAVFFALMDERLEQRSAQVAEVLAAGEPGACSTDLADWSRRGRRRPRRPRGAVRRVPGARVAQPGRRGSNSWRGSRRCGPPTAARSCRSSPRPAWSPRPRSTTSRVIVQVLDTFVPLQRAVDPDGVREGFLFDVLGLLFRASVALSEADATA